MTLPRVALDALSAHREEQMRQREFLGAAYQDQGLVVAEPDGRLRAPHALTEAFSELVRKIQLPRVTFHDLRHSHATLLLTQQVHPKVVSERLGHSTVNLTLNTYSHVLPSLQEDAARQVDDALRKASDVEN